MAFVAKKIFLTKGVGKHRERLSSFELALRNAGIAACNVPAGVMSNCSMVPTSFSRTSASEETTDPCSTSSNPNALSLGAEMI